MQDVYATTFSLVSHGADPFEEALVRTSRWLVRRIGTELDFSVCGADQHAAEDATVSWARRQDTAGEREAFDLVLEHPAEEDSNDRWRAAVVVSRESERCRATVRVSRGSTVHRLRPRAYKFGPPGLVSDLLRKPLHGYAGALEVEPRALSLRADRVADFVADRLRQGGRVLPVVVCDAGASAPLTASRLAERLVGLAHVVSLHSAEAWEALRFELASHYVPYGGARLYWPGFGEPGDRIRHPYYTRTQLRHGGLDRRLSTLLRELSVSRVPRDRLPDRLHREELRQRRARPSGVPERDQERDQRLAQLEAEVADIPRWLDELEEAENRVDELQLENARLAADLAAAQSNLESVWRYQEEAEEEEADSPASVPEGFGDDFVEAVEGLLSPALAFTDRALRCGQTNAYPRPADMYQALVGLEGLARDYHDRRGDIGQDLVTHAKVRHGLRLALHDHTYANTTFEFEGSNLDRLPHVKIDDYVAPNEVGRIYFALDARNGRLVVDWFGVKRDRPT